MIEMQIARPNAKQEMMLKARTKHVGFGGARGGGKSWAVRTKAKLLALRYPGIRILIVRRTYPELMNNHIEILRTELLGIAKYNDKDKVLRFQPGLGAGGGNMAANDRRCGGTADGRGPGPLRAARFTLCTAPRMGIWTGCRARNTTSFSWTRPPSFRSTK